MLVYDNSGATFYPYNLDKDQIEYLYETILLNSLEDRLSLSEFKDQISELERDFGSFADTLNEQYEENEDDELYDERDFEVNRNSDLEEYFGLIMKFVGRYFTDREDLMDYFPELFKDVCKCMDILIDLGIRFKDRLEIQDACTEYKDTKIRDKQALDTLKLSHKYQLPDGVHNILPRDVLNYELSKYITDAPDREILERASNKIRKSPSERAERTTSRENKILTEMFDYVTLLEDIYGQRYKAETELKELIKNVPAEFFKKYPAVIWEIRKRLRGIHVFVAE